MPAPLQALDWRGVGAKPGNSGHATKATTFKYYQSKNYFEEMDSQTVIGIAGALVISLVIVYIGVAALNKEAKAKGTTEKGYSIGAVITGFIILFLFLLYEFLFKGRYRR